MAKKEVQTDLWVHDLLKEAGVELDAQGSTIKEIDEALKTASKRGTGKVGFPEYVGVVKDFILVVGSCFYEPFEFVASDHITHLKNKEINKFQYLFEATLLNRFSEKYNFNREINDVRISKEIILLPVDYAGNPDYSYMESYIKNLMAQKYTEYLEFKNKTHIEYKVDSAYGL